MSHSHKVFLDWGGWMKVSYIRSWGERTTPYKRGDISTHRGAFWTKPWVALDSGWACPGVSCVSPKRIIPRWQVVVRCYNGIRAMDRLGVPARTLGPWEGGGWRYPASGVEENEPCLISVGTPQPIEAPFEDKTVRGALDSGWACPGVSFVAPKWTISR